MSAVTERIVFLDKDHVLSFIRSLLDAGDREAAVADFLAPEPISDIDLESLTSGLSRGPDLDVVQAPTPFAVAELDPTVVILRRGRMDAPTMQASPRLRLIQRLGHRSEGIDLVAARQRGVVVSCLSRLSLVSVAEHVLMLTLALSRRLLESDEAVRNGRRHPLPTPGADGSVYNWAGIQGITTLHGKTMGVIGLGEVGVLVAEKAHALGMTVVHHNRAAQSGSGGEVSSWRSLPDLLALSDVVTLHVPGSNATQIIDAQFLDAMRPNAVLVNTSRGYLVDEDALYHALVGRKIAGAALDVHALEPRPPDRFTALDNVVLTPHVASGSRRAVLAEAAAIFSNVHAAIEEVDVPHGVVVGAADRSTGSHG